MKAWIKTAIIASAAVILAAICFYVWGIRSDQRRRLACLDLNVEYADDFTLITKKDIEGYLAAEYGSFIGQRLDSVNLRKIEGILNSKSAVLATEAYTTPDGLLNVRIHQREPAVRFQKGDVGFYADERGCLFPLQSSYRARIMIVDGNVPLTFTEGYKGEPESDREKAWLADTIEMIRFIKNSKTWSGIICQINVDQDGDMILIPREGKERFIFGKPVEIAEKFARMEKYYTSIVPAKGKDTYSTVNLKYDGQIVCRK